LIEQPRGDRDGGQESEAGCHDKGQSGLEEMATYVL
jgi:hypothetical protein